MVSAHPRQPMHFVYNCLREFAILTILYTRSMGVYAPQSCAPSIGRKGASPAIGCLFRECGWGRHGTNLGYMHRQGPPEKISTDTGQRSFDVETLGIDESWRRNFQPHR